jgi:DNA processing protein
MRDLKYWIGFNIVPGIGAARFQALLDFFGDAATAWHAGTDDLRAAGLDRRSLENLLTFRATLDLDKEVEKIERMGIQVLTVREAGYPSLLREVHHPPPVLYVRGELAQADEWSVAFVGTRRATVYGREVARRLAGDVAGAGITIVSGLARGIDAQAHQAAVDAGGRTIAVLGCGIDRVYPAEHAKLARVISEHGALVTEYPMGTPPDAANFPPRNRIISGLSLGVVVVEADETSGAMITANFGLEQGRDVFAVPGPIFSRQSRGTNRLIQTGAKLILSYEDILEELNLTMVAEHREVQAIVPENETESLLLQYLSYEPVHIDELGRESGLPITTVSSTLALMELKGMVKQVGGMNYVVARERRAEYRVE